MTNPNVIEDAGNYYHVWPTCELIKNKFNIVCVDVKKCIYIVTNEPKHTYEPTLNMQVGFMRT